MFSNSDVIFEQLAKALYRSTLFVSYADLTGGDQVQLVELQSLSVLMHVLRDSHPHDLVIQDVVGHVLKEIQEAKLPGEMGEDELAHLKDGLQAAPVPCFLTR